MNSTAPDLRTKSHYQVLDGLRGVAALMVVIFHTCEANNGGSRFRQIINHGYMAVDFFFLLSGFVIAYAYDDRWGRMTYWDFFKRRLIRLQPMVVMGSIVGAIFFYFGASSLFPLIAGTPVWKMLLVMVVGMTLLPLPVSMDIRGWAEMHPLNGPAWSLFFEYIANIMYAFGLRRLSNKMLGFLAVLAGAFLLQLAVFGRQGDVIGGWSITGEQLHIGFARLLYPFLAGMLLMRTGLRLHLKYAFAICSAMLVLSFSLPRFGGPAHLWVNGLYEAVCILFVYPLIVAIGAGEKTTGPRTMRACRFLGDLSYPLYITHYALVYVYTAWVVDKHPTGWHSAQIGALEVAGAVILGYGCLKLYDEPVRNWLSQRFLPRAVRS